MPDCSWKLAIMWFVYGVFEAWLGKTDKTKSGSIPELIWNVTLGKLFKKKEEKDDAKTL